MGGVSRGVPLYAFDVRMATLKSRGLDAWLHAS
jgi:hypothetical protein